MPPNYLRRFNAAHDVYRRTRQRAAWHLFLDQVRKERAAANVVVSSSPIILQYFVDNQCHFFGVRPLGRFVTSVCFSGPLVRLRRSLFISSSVAFLAVPNLVDVAQFLIILSIGLSLGSVVMGFNGDLDEKLSELQYIPDHSHSYAISLQRVI
jgi:hypothetical protein